MNFLLSKRWLIALVIAGIVLILLLATAPQIGLTWDEPAYIAAADSYMGWFGKVFTDPAAAFSPKTLSTAWGVNSEHPPLDKVWSGVVYLLTRNFTDDLTAHRIGNMILVAVMIGLIYYLVSESYGNLAGFSASAALLTMPRFFFHAHLAALDVPAAFSVVCVIFVFWKTLSKPSWKWSVLLGVVWGLALATKINAIFVPVGLVLWWLIFRRDRALFFRFLIMGMTAIPVFILVWPWLYVDTFSRIWDYLLFMTVTHWKIGQYYLGHFFMPPPWHFGFVMLWAVLPLGITILYFAGIAKTIRVKENRQLGWLLILNAVIPILAIANGRSMVYDNDRLMMASFPFLACLAGIGLQWIVSSWGKLAERFKQPYAKTLGVTVLLVLAFVPQLISMVRLYPHYLSYYGEGVGGLPGATRMGLETTYWCETYKLALPILNEQAQPNAKIWVDPWSHDVMIYYQTIGLLRDDLIILVPSENISVFGVDAPQPVVGSMAKADWFVYEYRQTTWGEQGDQSEIARVIARQQLIYEYRYDDIPLLGVYKAP